MNREKEIAFLDYWEKNREKEGRWQRQLLLGFPMGLVFATPILVVLFSGRYWYVRADAAAQSKTSPVVMILAVLIISTFIAFFYKKHQWEMKDQFYRERRKLAQKDKEVAAKESPELSLESEITGN